jgi:hypothetical protein
VAFILNNNILILIHLDWADNSCPWKFQRCRGTSIHHMLSVAPMRRIHLAKATQAASKKDRKPLVSEKRDVEIVFRIFTDGYARGPEWKPSSLRSTR